MFRRFVVLLLVVFMAVGAVGCAQQATPPKKEEPKTTPTPAPSAKQAGTTYITIGTAAVGGVFYPVGMAMAKIWNDKIPNMKAVAIATAGSPQNIEMMRTKDIEVSVLRSLEGYRAIRGEDPYKEKMPWLKSLTGPLYSSGQQIVALKNKNIKSVADFKGRKVAVGPVGSGGEIDARALFDAYGLAYSAEKKDIKPEYVEAAQAVEMLNDGLIDGAILGLTIGASAIQELMLTGKVILLPIDDKAFANLKAKQPFLTRFTIKKGTYPNQDYDVITSGSPPTIIACREDLPEALAYQMCKLLYENVPDMKAAASIMNDFKLEDAGQEQIMPYHAGAIKYFKEKGIIK
ncbi:MAG: TAXI family TRAP transporter solute-binding subunit [Bacillota bacterium]|nr:TAXI family TRAP transporter solute-binding subunit [Bacillota bacterium]